MPATAFSVIAATPAPQPTPAWLLAYDIGTSRHRSYCHRTLRKLAEGYQKSVFEVLAYPEDVRAMLKQMAEPLRDRDSVLAARVLPFRHAWQLGRGTQSPKGDLIVID